MYPEEGTMLILGIVIAVIGVIVFIVRTGQVKKGELIAGTETSRVGELLETAKSVAQEIGAGSFNQFVEIKGTTVCNAPLTSELARVPCVHYSLTVTREWEETYWDKDSEGRSVQRTRSGSDIVASNNRSTIFYVDDGTGRVRVNPEGAELIKEKAFSQFQPGEAQGSTLRIGAFSFNIENIGVNLGGGRRTLGYRYEEHIIPVGKPVYILGEASDASGKLTIIKPTEKSKKLLISVKSEEELMKSVSTTKLVLLIIACLLLAGGAVLIVLSLF